MIQNSADAKAKSVVINFSSTIPGGLTKTKVGDISSISINRLTVKNNGLYFQNDDWNRLKEIAKGNPDETKIGAFGVGFYSVFELTDEPLVHSGDTVMSFYYEGDQLCYRKDKIQDSEGWTVIDIPYRSEHKLPNLPQFTAFLTLSFILLPIESIELKVDDISLFHLSKTVSEEIQLDLPKGINYYSPDQTLLLKSWFSQAFTITIDYMNVTQLSEKLTNNSLLSMGFRAFSSFIPGSTDPSESTQVSASLRKVTGKLGVNVSSSFSRKMKETVLKPPPKEAIISMLIDSRDEKEQSKLKPPLADYVFPKQFNDAKIFIGFPTKQSTSFKSHVAINQLIPTMERTAVDMANAYVKDWNKQILIMTGILSRAVYEYEFAQLSKKFQSITEKSDEAQKKMFYEDASYIMNRFEFHASTPDTSIGQLIAYGFWQCSRRLALPTQNFTIQSSDTVRLADDNNALDLIENIPIVPAQIVKLSENFLKKAVELRLLKETNALDIERELKESTLNIPRFQSLISWCLSHYWDGSIRDADIKLILAAAIVSDNNSSEDPDNPQLYHLKAIETYQNSLIVPNSYPLPPTCLPEHFLTTIKFRMSDVENVFSWPPLSLLAWLEYATLHRDKIPLEKNMFLSPEMAEAVLKNLDRNIDIHNPKTRSLIGQLLADKDCIPTNLGMKRPSESYFQKIDLFPDLPVISSKLLVSKEFLLFLGVRESVDVAFVLKLLTDPDPQIKWSTFDVIKYLTANKTKFKASDWFTLKNSPFFESTTGKLYMASELYPPNKTLEQLGFQCLKWDYWLDSTPEAKLVYELGLKHHPPQEEILNLADFNQVKNEKKRELAFQYYIKNFETNKYSAKAAYTSKSCCVKCLLPGDNNNIVYRPPNGCYTNPAVQLFGLHLVHPSLANEAWKLNIADYPDTSILVRYLVLFPPKDLQTANKMFEFLSTIFGKISKSDRNTLKQTKFIPVPSKSDPSKIEHQYPSMVFFAKSSGVSLSSGNHDNQATKIKESLDEKIYSKFFNFVDFSLNSRPFLSYVGVRDEPSIVEITHNLVDNPSLMYTIASSTTSYLTLLLRIASQFDTISRDAALMSKMRTSKFLLGTIYSKDQVEKKNPSSSTLSSLSSSLSSSVIPVLMNKNDDEDEFKLRYKLASVDEIVLVDDVVFSNLFKHDILVAPQITQLESFYESLGCRQLSRVIEVRRTLGKPIVGYESDAELLLAHIIERCTLFIESTRDEVNHRKAVSFLKNLRIVGLSKIVVQYQIRFRSLNLTNSPPIQTTVTAHLVSSGPGNAYSTLYVVPESLDWFDISHSLVNALVSHATPDSAIVLEYMLTSNLKSLQRKGYNVSSIIKKREKQAEEEAAKILADELKSQQEMEKLEKERAIEAQKVSQMAPANQNGLQKQQLPLAKIDNTRDKENNPVGGGQGWDKVNQALKSDKPLIKPSSPPSKNENTKSEHKGFFNRMMKNIIAPPKSGNALNNKGSSLESIQGHAGPSNKPTDMNVRPDVVPNESSMVLQNGIKKLRPYGNDTLNSNIYDDNAGSDLDQQLKEMNRFAEHNCGNPQFVNDLWLATSINTTSGGGIKLFLSKRTLKSQEKSQAILNSSEWMQEADRFSYILRLVAYIYGDGSSSLPWQTFHLFWDDSGIIAFNSGGALFFNLSYFVEGNALVPKRLPGSSEWYPSQQLDYWFIVAAHELAHNLALPHGASHTHFMSGYIQQYLGRYKSACSSLFNGPVPK